MATKYACTTCGLSVAYCDGVIIRGCPHDTAGVTATIKGHASGSGKSKVGSKRCSAELETSAMPTKPGAP